MKLILEENELEEILPVEPSEDKTIIINPKGNKTDNESDIVKEMAAIDALMVGPSTAGNIHDVSVPSASRYSNGKDIANEEVRARVLSKKYDIQDTATTLLMDTLGCLEPEGLKNREKISLVGTLGSLVEKITDKTNNGIGQVHLHIHAPETKPEKAYKIIEA